MSKKIPVHPAGAPIPAGLYSPAIIAGDFVYVSGKTPKKPGASEVAQGDVQSVLPGSYAVEIDVIALRPVGEAGA